VVGIPQSHVIEIRQGIDLTLGRVKTHRSPYSTAAQKAGKVRGHGARERFVSGVELMKSELMPDGVKYAVLHRMAFKQMN